MRIRNTDHNSGSKFFFLPAHRLVQEPVPKNLNIKNVLLINKIKKIWIWRNIRNVKKFVLPVDNTVIQVLYGIVAIVGYFKFEHAVYL